MTEKQDADRTETARRHDDSELIESMEPAPSQAGRSGGGLATDVGTQDELCEAVDPDAGVTRLRKEDKVQPRVPTRADNDGARG